ncbi:hypothetical protein C8R44DRAFT_726234 [Mycena epipterygia]|nr:hypothetical protein C8R44DRAFT_726234 [Mycena epipterygia]
MSYKGGHIGNTETLAGINLDSSKISSVSAGTYFRVNPEDAIFPILEGTGDMAQLLMAGEIVRSRIVLAQGFIRKYAKELRNPDRIEDYLPALTATALGEDLKTPGHGLSVRTSSHS